MKNIIQDIDYALKSYSLLQRINKNGVIVVVGEIILKHPDIGEYDNYAVSISFPHGYPYYFPKVIEESKKIPRIADRHVNDDNTLCLAVYPEEKAICKNGITFKFFLDKILVPHLSRETHRSLSPGYKDGEYSHGLEGIWEFFGEKLHTSDKKSIVQELEKMLYSKLQGRNEPCFCGSNIKFKNCHLKKWSSLINIERKYLISQLEIIKTDL